MFYGEVEGSFYLSDDAEWVRQKVGDLEMDPVAKEEFELAGYVTGQDTLYPNVKQIQAGSYVDVRTLGKTITVKQIPYYRFNHKPTEFTDENILYKRFISVVEASVQRLIDYADGRQILVPLSGGYDSRLIISMLKRLGYENVLCFSYGRSGNTESKFSRTIAESLGYAWLFVEYDNNTWATEWKSSKAAEYRRMASNHTSLPHVQDWLAINLLHNNGKINKNCVVVPGHCCVTGFITKKINSGTLNERTLYKQLISKHFNARPIGADGLTSSQIMARLERWLTPFTGQDEFVSRVMEFNWIERQSKYIANSVRVYEQYGLDWWLPLWDREFVDYWKYIPVKHRVERKSFKTWVEKLYQQVADLDLELVSGNAVDSRGVNRILIMVAKRLPVPLLVRLRNIRSRASIRNHFLAFDGLVPPPDLKCYLGKNYGVIGMFADLFLKGKWGA